MRESKRLYRYTKPGGGEGGGLEGGGRGEGRRGRRERALLQLNLELK